MWINCRKCGQLMDDCYTIPDYVCFDCWDEAEANGELYYCSDCCQASVLPLKDNKCEECSSRSASSGKKNKSKIQKAAALIMAMMIALSCLCMSAFADEVQYDNDHHTYMGYDTISYDIGDSISNSVFLSYAESVKSSTGENVVAFFLIDFDSNGSPHFYSHTQYGYFGYTELGTDDRRFVGFNGGFTDYYSTDYLEYSANYSYSADGQSYRFKSHSDLLFSDGKTVAFSYTDGVSGFSGFLGNEKYLVAVPCADSQATTMKAVLSELLDGTFENQFIAAEPKPEAAFITAKTPEPGKVTVIDWVGAGTQYPLFDFWIDDNKCYDTYALRISSNDSYAQRLLDKGKTDNTIDWVGYGSTFSTQQVSWIIQALNYDQLQWDVERNITDASFTFADTDLSNRRGYTICLSDYLTIVEYLLYRAEIIDISTGKLVAVTYFSTNRTYNKGSSGYGSTVSHYSDDNNSGWEMDLNDGKFGNADQTDKQGSMTVDNKNDIVVNYDPSGLSLDSFTDYLSGLSGQLGGFFTACWGIVPAEMMIILVGGLTIMVTCALILLFARR